MPRYMVEYTSEQQRGLFLHTPRHMVPQGPPPPVLVPEVAERPKQIMHTVAEECGAEVIEFEVMPKHLHRLVDVDPQFGVHKLVRKIKGRSSRLGRDEFRWLRSRLPTLWTNSYFVATVGGAPLAVVKQYIEEQKRG